MASGSLSPPGTVRNRLLISPFVMESDLSRVSGSIAKISLNSAGSIPRTSAGTSPMTFFES